MSDFTTPSSTRPPCLNRAGRPYGSPNRPYAAGSSRAFVPDMPPLVVDERGAAYLCQVSIARWRELVETECTPSPLYFSARPIWSIDDLRLWLAAGTPMRGLWELRRENR